jgi:hypothetical protein
MFDIFGPQQNRFGMHSLQVQKQRRMGIMFAVAGPMISMVSTFPRVKSAEHPNMSMTMTGFHNPSFLF